MTTQNVQLVDGHEFWYYAKVQLLNSVCQPVPLFRRSLLSLATPCDSVTVTSQGGIVDYRVLKRTIPVKRSAEQTAPVYKQNSTLWRSTEAEGSRQGFTLQVLSSFFAIFYLHFCRRHIVRVLTHPTNQLPSTYFRSSLLLFALPRCTLSHNITNSFSINPTSSKFVIAKAALCN